MGEGVGRLDGSVWGWGVRIGGSFYPASVFSGGLCGVGGWFLVVWWWCGRVLVCCYYFLYCGNDDFWIVVQDNWRGGWLLATNSAAQVAAVTIVQDYKLVAVGMLVHQSLVGPFPWGEDGEGLNVTIFLPNFTNELCSGGFCSCPKHQALLPRWRLDHTEAVGKAAALWHTGPQRGCPVCPVTPPDMVLTRCLLVVSQKYPVAGVECSSSRFWRLLFTLGAPAVGGGGGGVVLRWGGGFGLWGGRFGRGWFGGWLGGWLWGSRGRWGGGPARGIACTTGGCYPGLHNKFGGCCFGHLLGHLDGLGLGGFSGLSAGCVHCKVCKLILARGGGGGLFGGRGCGGRGRGGGGGRGLRGGDGGGVCSSWRGGHIHRNIHSALGRGGTCGARLGGWCGCFGGTLL